MEDDDHLSSGSTENGARTEGLNFYRLAFFLKGKVLRSSPLPAGRRAQAALARQVLVETGQCWQALVSPGWTSCAILGP